MRRMPARTVRRDRRDAGRGILALKQVFGMAQLGISLNVARGLMV